MGLNTDCFALQTHVCVSTRLFTIGAASFSGHGESLRSTWLKQLSSIPKGSWCKHPSTQLPAAAALKANTIPAMPTGRLSEGHAAAGTCPSMQAETARELCHVQDLRREPKTLSHLGHHLNFDLMYSHSCRLSLRQFGGN